MIKMPLVVRCKKPCPNFVVSVREWASLNATHYYIDVIQIHVIISYILTFFVSKNTPLFNKATSVLSLLEINFKSYSTIFLLSELRRQAIAEK